MKEWKHKCLRSVITYRPDPLRPECVTVGFVLFEFDGEARRVAVRFAPDLQLIRCISPEEDPENIEAMLLEIEPDLKTIISTTTETHRFRWVLTESIPEEIELLPATAVLTNDFEAEIESQEAQLFRAVDLKSLLDKKREKQKHGRLFLQSEIRQAFVQFGAWDFVDTKIAVDQFTVKNDPYKIDLGYLDVGRNAYRMLDAVSLITNLDRAKVLALSWPRIQAGLQKERSIPCEMYAIVEYGPAASKGLAVDARGWMEEAGIRVEPVSAVSALAAQAREGMRL